LVEEFVELSGEIIRTAMDSLIVHHDTMHNDAMPAINSAPMTPPATMPQQPSPLQETIPTASSQPAMPSAQPTVPTTPTMTQPIAMPAIESMTVTENVMPAMPVMPQMPTIPAMPETTPTNSAIPIDPMPITPTDTEIPINAISQTPINTAQIDPATQATIDNALSSAQS
jgi:hypothetical protein